MASPKQRRFVIRQRSKRRKRMGKAVRMTGELANALGELRAKAIATDWTKSKYDFRDYDETAHLHGFKTQLPTRPEDTVARFEGFGFGPLIRRLRDRFPDEKLEVLNEGGGRSVFPDQLQQEANQVLGENNMRVTTSDIRPLYARPTFTAAATEQLVHSFGKERFHLILSTYGGPSETTLPFLRGFMNILGVLKRGGEARIRLGANDPQRNEKVKHALGKMQKWYPAIRISLEEKKYNSGYRITRTRKDYYIVIQKPR